MADNFTWEESASGIEFASDDVAGVHYQKVKVAFGADDSATNVASGSGLPVELQAGVFGYDSVDDAVSQDPVAIGGRAYAGAPAAVSADGDLVWALLDRIGRLAVQTYHPGRWQAVGEYATAQTNASLKAAPGAGLSLYVTDVIFNSAVAGTLKLLDGSGGSTLYTLPAIAANGGASSHLQTPLKLTANTALCVTTTGTGNMGLLVCGFTAA